MQIAIFALLPPSSEYICPGYVAVPNLESKPNLENYRCIKNQFVHNQPSMPRVVQSLIIRGENPDFGGLKAYCGSSMGIFVAESETKGLEADSQPALTLKNQENIRCIKNC